MSDIIKKRVFVRYLFGSFGKCYFNEISNACKNKIEVPYIVYVFGEENEKMLNDIGLKTILVDKREHPWRNLNLCPSHQLLRPKLEIIKIVLQDYDSAVFLDWDCIQIKTVPEDIWERMELKGEIQACMQNGIRRLCKWRNSPSLFPNGGFLYLRNKELPQQFIDFWDTHPEIQERGNDEIAIAGALDYFYFPLKHGSKQNKINLTDWWDNYETEFCLIPYDARNVYEEKKILTKKIIGCNKESIKETIDNTNICFLHFMKARDIEGFYKRFDLF